MGWWSFKAVGTPCRVVVLHIDLARHSDWVRNSSTDLAVARSRTEFAELLSAKLRARGFERAGWAGDGGFFAREYIEHRDANQICLAADAAFECFRSWRPSGSKLAIRVVGEYLPDAILDRDPAYWCSESLNVFLKYEREISRPSCFVITDDLRRAMDPSQECFSRFEMPVRVTLPNGKLMTAWIDTALSDPAIVTELRRAGTESSSKDERLARRIEELRAELKDLSSNGA